MEESPEIVLSAIHIYPIKSLKGIALDEARVDERGLQHDRRWMLVNEENEFLTQREHPRMATISVRLEAEGLRLSAAGMQDLLVPFSMENPLRVQVRIWRSVCEAWVAAQPLNEWFSQFLQAPCKLVYMPDETRRAVNQLYAVNHDVVSFADGYPFKLIGEATLADLNGRLEKQVPMNRFRPNFVLSGSGAFAEDDWKRIHIGDTLFHLVKACERCQITTIDQDEGVRMGQEPLRTLAKYRVVDDKVLFGQYMIADNHGQRLRVGDRVEVVARKDAARRAGSS
jgi:uncharacterized protein YcbX